MSTPPATQPRRLSLLHRVAGTFFSPGSVFESLRDYPSWLGPVLIATVITLILTLAAPADVIRAAIEARVSEGGTPVPPERLEQMMKIGRITGLAAAVIGPVLAVLVTAAALYFLFSLLGGSETSFRHHFAVASHGWLIPTLGGIISFPILLAKRDFEVRLSLALATGLNEGFLYDLLNSLTLFGIWASVVLGIGEAKLGRRAAAGGAIAAVLALYFAFALVRAGIGALT